MSEARFVVARNRRARHDYEILETFEAGIALLGPEVKSIREGKASLAEAYATVDAGQVWLREMHVPEYSHKGYAPHEPKRPRKLLLHRREIGKLEQAVTKKGLTLVPLELYFLRGRAKVEIAVARGRKRHDKREAVREKEARKAMRRAEGRRA